MYVAHEILSLNLVAESHVVLQLLLWILFPLLLITFSVGFVQLVSIHAIGNFIYQGVGKGCGGRGGGWAGGMQ